MQFIKVVQQKAAHFASENATVLLTVGGVVGTVATAVLTGRAGFKAAEIIRQHELENIHTNGETDVDVAASTMGLSKTEKLKLVWPYFVPPLLTGTATLASIIMANRMSASKATALAAAYGLVQKDFEEYKKKVETKLTGPKQQEIVDELAHDRLQKDKGYQTLVMIEGTVLCYDKATSRYFNSTMENIKSAVNRTNQEVINNGYADATFFYHELGLPATTWSEEVGWNIDQLLELDFTTDTAPDGRPCIVFNFKYIPRQDFIPKHY